MWIHFAHIRSFIFAKKKGSYSFSREKNYCRVLQKSLVLQESPQPILNTRYLLEKAPGLQHTLDKDKLPCVCILPSQCLMLKVFAVGTSKPSDTHYGHDLLATMFTRGICDSASVCEHGTMLCVNLELMLFFVNLEQCFVNLEQCFV